MTPSAAQQHGKRRGRAIPLVAAIASLALHGLAIASIVGWPDAQAPDAQPQIIAVGVVFAEQHTSDPAETAVTHEASTARQSDESNEDTVENTVAIDEPPPILQPATTEEEPVAVERPPAAPEPVPPFVEGTQLALFDSSFEEAESGPTDPFVFFDEGTVLIDRSPDVAPGTPAHRPAPPIAFRPIEPPVAEAPVPEPPVLEPQNLGPSTQDPTAAEPGPAAERPDDAQPATPSAMALQPARYTGPGLANPGPEYPRSARRRGDEGTVILRVMVSAAGLPQHIQIRSSSGVQVLDQAAVEAVEGWRFIPARHGDIAVPATIDVPIAFRLTAD